VASYANEDPQAHFKKSVNSYGNELLGTHLLKEIINEFMGIFRLIYLKKSLMSYGNGLLGFPGHIYLKKSVISYAIELLRSPRLTYLRKMLSVCGRREAYLLKESCGFYVNVLPGSPGPHLLQKNVDFLCKRAPGNPQAHLRKDICDFLCK